MSAEAFDIFDARREAIAESWRLRKTMRDWRPDGRPIPDPPRTPAYGLDLTCPYCGGDVEHRADGSTTGWSTSTVVTCTECKTSLIVSAQVTAAGHVRTAARNAARSEQLAEARAARKPKGALR